MFFDIARVKFLEGRLGLFQYFLLLLNRSSTSELTHIPIYNRYQVSFYLWWLRPILKHCKVTKYYNQDCRSQIKKQEKRIVKWLILIVTKFPKKKDKQINKNKRNKQITFTNAKTWIPNEKKNPLRLVWSTIAWNKLNALIINKWLHK